MDEKTRRLQEEHVRLIVEANKMTNLTRIDSWDSAMLLHLEDSLVGAAELDDAPAGRSADLGSGAGFPGIPLYLETGRPFLLVESVGKKIRVLDDVLKKLGIDSEVKTYNGRIEELALEQPESFAAVTARALTALNSLMELASPLLQQGGRLVAYKSAACQEELDVAKGLQEKLGMKFISVRNCTLSDGKTRRSIVVFEKVAEPQVMLPRRVGMAQKRPYK